MNTLLGADGKPLVPSPREDVQKLQRQIAAITTQMTNERFAHRREIRAKYDAAQTHIGNENHWGQSDTLSPHAVASYQVRKTLRSRSRYELCENNPYLKGTCLTIVNDFIGSGPKLQVTDERIPDEKRKIIQKKFSEWATSIKLRQKLWRLRMSKIVDGESFLLPYSNKRRFIYDPVQLDFQVIEADRITTQHTNPIPQPNSDNWEVDGVRFDANENPLAYYLLSFHPGSVGFLDRFISPGFTSPDIVPTDHAGKWIPAKYMIHWFRQDRGWLRGIPEATASLPLCAILRRYTLAVVRNAEAMADITVLLETENPAGGNPYATDASGNTISDDPFDLFPLEMGMAMNLPWGMVAKQLSNVPLGIQFDEFVGSLLREISRPILSPYNITSGSSKDSNMASGVLDATIYKGGQRAERLSIEEEVLCRIFYLWWQEAIRIPGHLGGNYTSGQWALATMPQHRWRWDRIGIDHTDPARVAESLKVMHDKRFMTDADIQDEYFNRDLDTWQDEIQEDDKFRTSLSSQGLEITADPNLVPPGNAPGGGGGKGSSPQKTGGKSSKSKAKPKSSK